MGSGQAMSISAYQVPWRLPVAPRAMMLPSMASSRLLNSLAIVTDYGHKVNTAIAGAGSMLLLGTVKRSFLLPNDHCSRVTLGSGHGCSRHHHRDCPSE